MAFAQDLQNHFSGKSNTEITLDHAETAPNNLEWDRNCDVSSNLELRGD